MSTTAPSSPFVRRVRGEMERQKLSVRGLARKIDPQNVERARRNLHRWLDEGIAPGRASRTVVAHALGIPESDLASDDDEEADAMADLERILMRLARKAVAETRAAQP